MRVCIIGAGNTGQAAAVFLKSMGIDCVISTRSEEKETVLNKQGIVSDGDIIGRFFIPAQVNLREAVTGADLIILMTTAGAHKDVAKKLKPILEPNQKIIIFNSNWGAFEFKQIFGDDIDQKNLTVAETNAQLFMSSSQEIGKINMRVKQQVSISATDARKTQSLIDFTKNIFPQFRKSSSIIQTTMESTNPLIHVPITLFNLVRVETSQHFLFYGDGVSETAVKLILNLDKERIAIARILGCEIDDVLTAINSFWEIKYDNLFDALTKNKSYLAAIGPKFLNHRYITEDIPYGIIPIAKLGKLFGIETPFTDSLINLLQNTIAPELIGNGVQFNREDFPEVIKIGD